VIVEFPVAAAEVAAKVIVLVLLPLPMLAGLAVADTFAGRPSTVMFTAPLKLPLRAIVAVIVPFAPCRIVSVAFDSVSVMLLPGPLESPEQAASSATDASATAPANGRKSFIVPPLIQENPADLKRRGPSRHRQDRLGRDSCVIALRSNRAAWHWGRHCGQRIGRRHPFG
jgi:hypothetical protein